jgi:hypothetical protein
MNSICIETNISRACLHLLLVLRFITLINEHRFCLYFSNGYFMKPIIRFYRQLKQALFVRDVYAPMFFCDFINMIIVIGFYSQFGVCIFQ